METFFYLLFINSFILQIKYNTKVLKYCLCTSERTFKLQSQQYFSALEKVKTLNETFVFLSIHPEWRV